MTDQMSCMGLDLAQEGAMERFMQKHWADKTVADLTEGVYVKLDAGAGICCILSVDRDTQEILDWDVHYAGNTRCGCAFDADLSLDDAGQSGFIRVLLKPGEEDIPVILSAPQLAPWSDREPGSPGVLQLSAYAGMIRLPDQTEEQEESMTCDPETFTVSITARVLRSERLTCPDTGRDFWHMEICCRGVELDLLAAEGDLPAMPEPGQRVSAECVLTALTESGETA